MEENKQKIPILHLTFTGMAQSRKVSEPCPRQRKNEEGKNDAPKRAPSLFVIHQAARVIRLFFWAKKDFCSFNFLLLSKRLKASLGNRVYFTHAYLLSIFSDLWGAIFVSSLENTLSWEVHIVRPLVKETQCEWRVFDLLFRTLDDQCNNANQKSLL